MNILCAHGNLRRYTSIKLNLASSRCVFHSCKMPKTRAQRCERTLKTFFDWYPFYHEIVKLDVQGYSVARYEITIPSKWTDTEPDYNVEQRTLTWLEIERAQTLPDAQPICDRFRDTYRPHETNNSYLRIHDTEISAEKIVLKLIVKYFKTDMPFPEDEITIEQRNHQLENQVSQLTQRLSEFHRVMSMYIEPLHQTNARLRRERNQAVDSVRECSATILGKYSEISELYRGQLRECYKDLGRRVDDCPVCYDPITNDKIFITPCRHVLCTSCVKGCNNSCPMCRQELGYVPS